jgi:hypothetical protein
LPRPGYRPRYKLPYEKEGRKFLLVVWPDDRYTLHSEGEEEGSVASKTLSAQEADAIICNHILNSTQSLLAAGLNEAFMKAAEGLRILSDAEHQMREELERRKRKNG